MCKITGCNVPTVSHKDKPIIIISLCYIMLWENFETYKQNHTDTTTSDASTNMHQIFTVTAI